jgi:hypothetical protein
MNDSVRKLVEAAELLLGKYPSHAIDPEFSRLRVAVARVREEQAKLEAGEERILCELLFGTELERGRMN